MEQLVKVFKLGSSTVITLPRKFGFLPGQKVRITKRKNEVVLKTDAKSRVEAIDKFVDDLSKGIKFKHHFRPDEMNRMYDEEAYKLPHEEKK